jgi:Zn-dependent protease with chaperone function
METHWLSQIHPDSFAHPHDLKASRALRDVPFLDKLLEQVARLHIEKKWRAHHMQSSIRLGPRQLPTLWRLVNDVADRFAMPLPHVYVSGEGGTNAFAFGMHEHSVVLTTSLVELMDDRELRAIVGHELGHILCRHMLYRGVGMALANGAVMTNVLARLMPVKALQVPLDALFFAWSRAAEYTADRAAVLVLDDPEAMVSCLSKLAGVPRRFLDEFDPHAFAEQAAEHEVESTLWSKIVTFDMGVFRSHPEPTRRALAVLEWYGSDEYRAIKSGRFLRSADVEHQRGFTIDGVASCRRCNRAVGDLPACPNERCGLERDPALHAECANGHVVSRSWRFCKTCGAATGEPPGEAATTSAPAAQ